MALKPITIIKNITGLNTVDKPYELPRDDQALTSALQYAVDVVVNRAMRLERADGYELKTALTDGHSLFGRDNSETVVAQGSELHLVDSDCNLSLLKTGLSGNYLDYVYHGNSIYYCNGTQTGTIHNGVAYDWQVGSYSGPNTDRPFQSTIPPFDHIAEHFGHIVGSMGPYLFASELGDPGLFYALNMIQFATPIRMIISVAEGLYVSDQEFTWFLRGSSPSNFVQGNAPVLPYPAIEWSAARQQVKGLKIGLETPGMCALWNSPEGPVAGLPDGTAINLVDEMVIYPPDMQFGASLIRGYDLIAVVDNEFCTQTNLQVGGIGRKATTQRSNYGFNSFARRGNDYLACDANGLYQLGGNLHDSGAIASDFETMSWDMRYEASKKVRFVYLNCETEGALEIIPVVDGVTYNAIPLTTTGAGMRLIRVPVPRGIRGVYWTFKIRNKEGCYFAVDYLKALSQRHARGRKSF